MRLGRCTIEFLEHPLDGARAAAAVHLHLELVVVFFHHGCWSGIVERNLVGVALREGGMGHVAVVGFRSSSLVRCRVGSSRRCLERG